MSSRLRLAETPYLRPQALDFQVGDTVDVATKIPDGDKERIQLFTGRVIRRRGTGLAETFTVRRIVMGEGVERIFPTHSPKVAGVRVVSRGEVRRSKLYYMRERTGKATRLKETLGELAGLESAAPLQLETKAEKAERAAEKKAAPKKPKPAKK